MSTQSFKGISSDNYEMLLKKNNDKESLARYQKTFAEGLAECEWLIDLKLPTEILDTPFFNQYYDY